MKNKSFNKKELKKIASIINKLILSKQIILAYNKNGKTYVQEATSVCIDDSVIQIDNLDLE